MNRRYWNELADDYINDIEKWLHTHCKISSAKKFALIEAKLDWSKRRRCSRGGWRNGGPIVSIAMSVAIPDENYNAPRRVYEYASFDSDKVIGGFFTNNLEHKLLHHITHEMAHAAQYNHKYFHKMSRLKPHGKEFKMFYSELRQVFLNPFLPNQELMETKYKKHKNMAITSELTNMVAASRV